MRVGTVITVKDGEPSLVRGLRRQSSVIMAIIFKDFKVRQRTSKFGIFYVLIEPMVFILAIASIRYLFRMTSVDGLHVLIWIPLGVALFLIFMRSVTKIPSALKSNQGLLDFPQVKPIDPVIAIFILEMTLTMVASGMAMFLIWWVMGVGPWFPRPLEAIGVIAALLAGCFGLALLLAVYGTFYENIPRTIRFLNRPIIFLSGVIFSVNVLPAYVREYLAWNPLLQFIEHFRLYAAGHAMIPEADLGYACFASALALGLGVIAYYANRHKLVQSR
jgi:capsular polysaccharide transport system permease protein